MSQLEALGNLYERGIQQGRQDAEAEFAQKIDRAVDSAYERAAREAYAQCLETHHVTLGEKLMYTILGMQSKDTRERRRGRAPEIQDYF